jgi:DNA-directed RNA polymerase specialized sigma24 family protein
MNMVNMVSVSNDEILTITAKMVGVGRKYGFQNADCLDLAQDVIYVAIRKYNPNKGAKFATFCWYLFNRKVIDGLRRINHKYYKKTSITKMMDKEEGNNKEIAGKRLDTMQVLKMHLKDNFDAGIITRKEHDVLVLRAHGNDFYEIASILDISLGSAHGTYQKGLALICEDDGILGCV